MVTCGNGAVTDPFKAQTVCSNHGYANSRQSFHWKEV